MSDDPPSEDDSEATDTSTQSFLIETGPDGISRTISMTETFSDGSTRQVNYEEVLANEDPYVRIRQRVAGEDPPSEIFTEFLPAPRRPATYPADMPFLEGRACYTTESPNGSVSPSVRWRCTDPDVVLAALIAKLVAEGWAPAPPSAMPSFLREDPGQHFLRPGGMRSVTRSDFEGGSVVSLLELSYLSGLG